MRIDRRALLATTLALGLAATAAAADELRGTGDLGVVVERASGSLLVVETSGRQVLHRVEGLGDLSHASVVFSRDARYAFVFGRDGGLSKVDLLTGAVAGRVVQAGNSIGGAISQDGKVVAVANYEPGGVRFFRAADLAPLGEIPATYGPDDKRSKVVGIEDLPDNTFVFSLYDGDAIWTATLGDAGPAVTRRFHDVGALPYDALVTPDGRHYIVGLFGEDGMVVLDLWDEAAAPVRILDGYGRGEEPLPVYKMPHLEGWSVAGDRLFLPAIGRHELLVVDRASFAEIGRVPVHSQPVFAIARPDGRQVWVNFAHPDNNVVQVIDVPSREVVADLDLGPGVLHMEFTPRGEEVWISVRDADRIDVIDTRTLERVASLDARKPSGIFFTARAHRIGY
jgi:protein NirF